ncbi:beclin-1-like isoform X2 [Watersipora subatra]|uniref:beclin-1-like isoform X2 n=1 Tax=Watersipora subatra TaxID=2589382 RepID=UPI00355B5B0A
MFEINGTDNRTSTIVSFSCQKCGAALRLDDSLLASHDKTFLQEAAVPIRYGVEGGAAPQASLDVTDYTNNYVKQTIRASAPESSEAEVGFTLVGAVGEKEGGIAQTIRVKTKLFDILSSQADLDHPICEQCTDELLDTLDDQLKVAEEECRGYKEFLDTLESGKLDGERHENYELTIAQLEEEEQALLAQIDQVDEECRKLDSELLAETGKQNDLKEEESEFLKEYHELKRQMFELETEEKSTENKYKHSEVQLKRLVQLNAFNVTFHIWHNDQFGTINGFRMGRLPNIPVEWNEINTAWGQTALLLHALARKMKLTFQRYRLVPYGNHSYMESLTDKSKELPLYCSGGYKFVFADKKFDHAMVAFLDCLKQLQQSIELCDKEFLLPYKISDDKLVDNRTNSSYSIRAQLNSEEQWTKALKFLLTTLKWCITWVSAQISSEDY